MADRFVLVSTRKWRDPWYRTLTLEQKHVWNYLTEYPDETQTGIIERLPADMAHECQIEISPFVGALERFEQDGRIIREGENFLFVRKFVKHQVRTQQIAWDGKDGKKADLRVNAINLELERLRAKCPYLVAEFEHLYKGADKPLASPLQAPTEGLQHINININKNINKTREQQPTVAGEPDGPPPAKVKKQPNPEKPEYVEVARQAAEIIIRKAAQYGIRTGDVNQDPDADAKHIRFLVEKDNLPLDKICEALEWCWDEWRGTFCWGPNLLSIQRWRDKGSKGISKFMDMFNGFSGSINQPFTRNGHTAGQMSEADEAYYEHPREQA